LSPLFEVVPTGYARYGWAAAPGAAPIGKLLAAFFGWSCKTYLLVSARKPS